MSYATRLLAATVLVTLGLAGTAPAQIQPRDQSFGTQTPDPGQAARWKRECERRADEKRLAGDKRTAVIKKCVDTGSVPPELE